MNNFFNKLLNIKYNFNESYGLSYITPSQYNSVLNILTNECFYKSIDNRELTVIKNIFSHYAFNYLKIKELESKTPRIIAQKFIGKKKIRSFIFNRDKCCLKCGTDKNLSIDHIDPISKGGENKISNLQTLCKSCNSVKRNLYKDYR